MTASLEACLEPGELLALQAAARRIHVAPALIDYVQALIEYTRRSPDYVSGLSPRAALALLACARAWALVEGRDRVIPEDVQAVLPGVAGHRLHPLVNGVRRTSSDIAVGLVEAVPIP
jgi:MoxR-like ATPase